MMTKRLLVVLAALSLLLGGVACSENARDDAAEVAEDAADSVEDTARDAADKVEDIVNDRSVDIDDFSYSPARQKITVGTEVTWVNDGEVDHTVTSDDDAFASEQIASDEEFSHRFTQKGEYEYHCENHPDQMKGSVVVSG